MCLFTRANISVVSIVFWLIEHRDSVNIKWKQRDSECWNRISAKGRSLFPTKHWKGFIIRSALLNIYLNSLLRPFVKATIKLNRAESWPTANYGFLCLHIYGYTNKTKTKLHKQKVRLQTWSGDPLPLIFPCSKLASNFCYRDDAINLLTELRKHLLT